MRRAIPALALLLALTLTPFSTLAHNATPAPPTVDCAAPATATNATPVTVDDTALAALAHLPTEPASAEVSRGEHAETGTLSLSLPGALSSVKVSATVKSNSAGPIGRVERTGDALLFSFKEITYDVSAITLPMGGQIAPQTIRLDPSQPSTLCVDLATGHITRNFHWLMTGTNVHYDGSPTIALGDRGRATVEDVTRIDPDHYAIHLLTHWQSEIDLKTWTLDGNTLPSGKIKAAAEFDGTYQLDFSK